MNGGFAILKILFSVVTLLCLEPRKYALSLMHPLNKIETILFPGLGAVLLIARTLTQKHLEAK